jgi:hypothetical protein
VKGPGHALSAIFLAAAQQAEELNDLFGANKIGIR